MKTSFSSPEHPFWPLAHLIVMATALVCVLYLNASTFDVTEWVSIGEMLVLLGGYEGLRGFMRKQFGHAERTGETSTDNRSGDD